MMDRHIKLEWIGNIAVVVTAILLATVIVAWAQTPDAGPQIQAPAVAADADSAAAAVRLELKRPKPVHLRAMPGAIAQKESAEDALRKLVAEHRCLAEAMYFEARGEGEAGERAVAQVVLHRLAEGQHGHTICAVVYEGAGQTFCQFTFVCDGALDRPVLPEPWREAQVLAARLLAAEESGNDGTNGATSYHAVSVRPAWAPRMERVSQIGNHVFYRARTPVISVAFRGSMQ